MKIAIVSTGLGHIARGVEAWALDSAVALASAGEKCKVEGERPEEALDVTLFCGGRDAERMAHPPSPACFGATSGAWREEYSRKNESCDSAIQRTDAGAGSESTNQRIIQSSPMHEGGQLRIRTLPCLRRGSLINRMVVRLLSPLGGWRYGFGSEYQAEQTTFAPKLINELRKGSFDIVHLQDPWLAWLLQKAGEKGKHPAHVILAHGTEESNEYLSRFEFIQQLAPWHLEQSRRALGMEITRNWCAIPNFVDTSVFTPAVDGEQRRESRDDFGLPAGAFVIGCVSAVKKTHKRLDYLMREFANISVDPYSSVVPYLVIAGAKTDETDELIKLAEELAPGRIKLLLDLDHGQMPAFYRSLDLLAHVSVFEMMPIALLEAMSSGLAVLHHDHPVMNWMVGDDLFKTDMRSVGSLAECLARLKGGELENAGVRARIRAETMFSARVVIPRMVGMYGEVGSEQ